MLVAPVVAPFPSSLAPADGKMAVKLTREKEREREH